MMKIIIPDFSIEQIANSGQCFRIGKTTEGKWRVQAFGKILEIQQLDEKTFIFDCEIDEYEKVWFEYFDLSRDYGEIKNNIMCCDDDYLIKAILYGYGIRVLKQELWEVIISFIISQRNNIPRIKAIIERLCKPHNGHFPSPEDLARCSQEELKAAGLGYRAEYISGVSRAVLDRRFDQDMLKQMGHDESILYLKQFKGIGDKVAHCISLYGLHNMGAFPQDVWIKRIIDRQYKGNFDISRFQGYAGIIQQYMFFYERFISKT